MHGQRELRILYLPELHALEGATGEDEAMDSTEFDLPSWPLDRISTNSKHFLMNNPSRRDDDPAYFFYYEDGVPIARLSTFSDTLVVGGTHHRWGWAADLKVKPEYRGQGVASAFIRAVLGHMDRIGWVYGGFGIAPSARRIYRRLEFMDMGRVPRYVRLLSAQPLICLLRARGHLARLLALPITWTIRPRRTEPATAFDAVTVFDHDLLPACVGAQGRITFLRTPDILNWRMSLATRSRRFCYRAFQTRVSSKATGWLVARFAHIRAYPNHPWIRDLSVCTIIEAGMHVGVDHRWNKLMNLALRTAIDNRSDVLEIYTSDPFFQRALKRRLFTRVGGQDFMFRLPEASSLPLESLRNPQEWSLVRGDSDGFYCL
jgi:GNAT superfamily N-acetyltransferase